MLIVQSDGEHKGQDGWTPNWYLRECYALLHACERLGIAADVWGLRHANFPNRPDFEAYDLLFCVENYEFGWLPNLRRIRRPLKVQWIVDLHCQPPSVYNRVTRGCDVVLHSTRRLINGYARRHSGCRHLWFPNAVDDRYFDAAKYVCEKTHDVIFVGSDLSQRREFLRELERTAGLRRFFATGRDMIDLVASARIHVNKNIDVDINARTFETVGLGTCLLTDHDPDLERLGFIDGVNCLLYRSHDEAVEKIRVALQDDCWERIGAAGYALSKQHTYTMRLDSLLKELMA